MWKAILVGLVAAPVLALFMGVGVVAMAIGDTWDARSTDSLITGLVATCGGGAVIIGVLLALIVGVPLALRAYERGGIARQAWPEQQYLPPSVSRQQPWQQQPPMLTDKQQGQWLSQGSQQYDLWDGQQAAEGEWCEVQYEQ